MKVLATGLYPVSFEHQGGTLIDSGYAWGAVIDNPTGATARDVSLVAEFKSHGQVKERRTYAVGDVGPGEFAWGTKPVVVANDAGDIDAVDVAVSAGRFDNSQPPVDRLLSPSSMAEPDWKGEITVEPINDPRSLFAMVAYYDASDRLVVVDPSLVVKDQLTPGTPSKVGVRAIPEGGPPGLTRVRVFLVRVPDPGVVMSEPAGSTPRA